MQILIDHFSVNEAENKTTEKQKTLKNIRNTTDVAKLAIETSTGFFHQRKLLVG